MAVSVYGTYAHLPSNDPPWSLDRRRIRDLLEWAEREREREREMEREKRERERKRKCEQMAIDMGLSARSQPRDICLAILDRIDWLSINRSCTTESNLGRI